MAMIYLIRHGQASFLSENYDQLSELGIRQSGVLGDSLKNRNQQVSKVGMGTLLRHQETADHCLDAFGEKVQHATDSRWNEYDHMELLGKHNPTFTDFIVIGEHIKNQGNPMLALQQILNASITDWIAGKHSYSVSWQSFKAGVWEALHDISSSLEKGQTAWVFTSGGPISAVLIQLLSLKDEQFVELQGRLVNSSVTKILVGKNRLSLSTYNDYSHLEHNSDLITYR